MDWPNHIHTFTHQGGGFASGTSSSSWQHHHCKFIGLHRQPNDEGTDNLIQSLELKRKQPPKHAIEYQDMLTSQLAVSQKPGFTGVQLRQTVMSLEHFHLNDSRSECVWYWNIQLICWPRMMKYPARTMCVLEQIHCLDSVATQHQMTPDGWLSEH